MSDHSVNLRATLFIKTAKVTTSTKISSQKVPQAILDSIHQEDNDAHGLAAGEYPRQKSVFSKSMIQLAEPDIMVMRKRLF